LALGLPTSATAAVILVAFQTYNIQAGPLLFVTNPDVVWTLIAALFVGNTLLLVLNLPFVKVWVKLLHIPKPYLFAGITTFALMGAYVANNAIFDLWIALGVALIGYVFRRFGVPITPLIIGLILSPMAELQMRRALQISGGEVSALYTTPLSKALYLLLAAIVFTPFIWRAIKKRDIKWPTSKK
jgi:putative tricarboxylic transport membrane protein